MTKIYMYIMLLVLSSCSLIFRPTHSSTWIELDQTASIECNQWPLGDKDLSLRSLDVIGAGDAVALLVEMNRRNGSRTHYLYNISNSTEIRRENVEELILGRGGIVVPSLFHGGLMSAVVARGEKSDSSVVEFINSKSHVVTTRGKILGGVREGVMRDSRSKYWFVYAGDGYQVGVLNKGKNHRARTALASVSPVSPVFTAIDGINLENRPTLVTSKDNDDVYLVNYVSAQEGAWGAKERRGGGADIRNMDSEFTRSVKVQSNFDRSTVGAFRIIKIDSSGKKVRDYQEVLPQKTDVESWQIRPMLNGFKLAYISGDSLIGQASLHVARVKFSVGGPRLAWERTVSLDNIHVSHPMWAAQLSSQTSKVDYLFFMKWVDGESTMAAYEVNGKGIKQLKNGGVFQPGAAITGIFLRKGRSSQPYAVIRKKVGLNWSYEVCNLSAVF